MYQRVDVPLKIRKDTENEGRQFILCDHNRDGDCYRSPWSNTYFPPLVDGFRPSEQLRKLELYANEVWDVYRGLYYRKGSVSSVYLWEKDDNIDGRNAHGGFAGCFLIKNTLKNDGESVAFGDWNSIHVVDVGIIDKGKCVYNITTTILLSLEPSGFGSTSISGYISRQNKREFSVSLSSIHIVNIGKMIEEVESSMRSEIDSLYIQKTRNVLDMMWRDERSNVSTEGQEHTKSLNEAVLAMAMKGKARLNGK
ncbi:hypothetical protein ACHAXS_004116 [Conticribra weissflogii]